MKDLITRPKTCDRCGGGMQFVVDAAQRGWSCEACEAVAFRALILEAERKVRPLKEQTLAISRCQDGWGDGRGKAVAKELVRFVETYFIKLEGKGISFPRLRPTLEGGVHAEWSWSPWVVTIQFKPDQTITLKAVNLVTSESVQRFDQVVKKSSRIPFFGKTLTSLHSEDLSPTLLSLMKGALKP